MHHPCATLSALTRPSPAWCRPWGGAFSEPTDQWTSIVGMRYGDCCVWDITCLDEAGARGGRRSIDGESQGTGFAPPCRRCRDADPDRPAPAAEFLAPGCDRGH